MEAEIFVENEQPEIALSSNVILLRFQTGIAMNDEIIRRSFHRQVLQRRYACGRTRIVDELGLCHGKCRADIAVVNGSLTGYEIKSDDDSLLRLSSQVRRYNAIFDRAFVITGTKHVSELLRRLPRWWGVIVCRQGPRGGISFETVRRAKRNERIAPMAIARLLWKEEVIGILKHLGCPPTLSRQRRALLYRRLAQLITLPKLQRAVRNHLKQRKNWRRPVPPFPNGG